MLELDDEGWARAACHCGAVRFRVRLSERLASARRCDCSLCRMRGAVAVTAGLDGVEVLEGAEALTEYRFNTGTARHYFCSNCGIYTHHRRRSNPNEYGVNAGCLEGVSPFDFAEVIVNDGVNHPSDGGGGVVGVLRYERTRDWSGAATPSPSHRLRRRAPPSPAGRGVSCAGTPEG